MSKCYKEYRAICKKEEETSLNDEERRRELSLYEFEVHEIEEAALRENEDEELEETYRRMTESRKITDAVAQTYRYTCEDSSANAGDCLTRRYVRFGRRRNLMKRRPSVRSAYGCGQPSE